MTSTQRSETSPRVTCVRWPVARRAAQVAAVVLAGLVVYQIALAAGAPRGRAAWGGTHRSLPTSLRVGTAVPITIYVFAALILLRRAGYAIPHLSPRLARRGTWASVFVFSLSALVNLASHSEWERLVMGPLAFALGALSVVIGCAEEGPL